MRNIAVIYKSKYGATKRYAEWIAQELDATLMDASQVKPAQLQSYDVVIYGGGLYASGILGVNLITENPCKQLIVFTVGLAKPEITDYSSILQKNFTPGLLAKIKVFHLRGGIDYKKLSLVHRGMMAMMKKRVKQKDEKEMSSEDKTFLETYGDKVDFTDKRTIEPILAFVKGVEF
jgi:menaquinone-dependent protoporphyrinogen IX oxidase